MVKNSFRSLEVHVCLCNVFKKAKSGPKKYVDFILETVTLPDTDDSLSLIVSSMGETKGFLSKSNQAVYHLFRSPPDSKSQPAHDVIMFSILALANATQKVIQNNRSRDVSDQTLGILIYEQLRTSRFDYSDPLFNGSHVSESTAATASVINGSVVHSQKLSVFTLYSQGMELVRFCQHNMIVC